MARPQAITALTAAGLAFGLSLVPQQSSLAATAIAPVPRAFNCGSLPSGNINSGQGVKIQARLGDIAALLTGLSVRGRGYVSGTLAHPGLTVEVAGQAIFKRGITGPATTFPRTGPPSWILASLTDRNPMKAPAPNQPLCIANFHGPAQQDAILLGFFSGGAHCCTYLFAYPLSPRSVTWPPVEQDLGNPGATLYSAGNYAYVVTADNSFAYRFDSYAASGMPVRVLELHNGRFVNTTPRYPSLIAADASIWWKAYGDAQEPGAEGKGGGLGLLAAWVADECMLGRCSAAWATVVKLQSEHRLTGGNVGAFWPRGAAYVSALKAFLKQHGYWDLSGP